MTIFILFLVIFPFATGIALFIFLSRKKASLSWQKYTLYRGLVFSSLLMPTFFIAGHGGIPTNTLAGFIAVLLLGNTDFQFNGILFGNAGGPAIYLESFYLGLAIYIVLFIARAFFERKNSSSD